MIKFPEFKTRFPGLDQAKLDLADFAFQDFSAYQRLLALAEVGREFFANSPIIQTHRHSQISDLDLKSVRDFLSAASPSKVNWRLNGAPAPKMCNQGDIDPSKFATFDSPGGSLEHFHVAEFVAGQILKSIRDHAPRSEAAKCNYYILKTAALLHDAGRLITHQFFLSDQVGFQLLQMIGVRDDILELIPQESLMLGEPNTMKERLFALKPGQVLLRLADEFGKRAVGTNRFLHPSECTKEHWAKWAAKYLSRPEGWVRVEREMRVHMARHLENEEPYYAALKDWFDVQLHGALSLTSFIEELDSGIFTPLANRPLISGQDLVNNSLLVRKISSEIGKVKVSALSFKGTRFGGSEKLLNEDGLFVIANEEERIFCLVDGATQIKPVEALQKDGTTGGAFVSRSVENNSINVGTQHSASNTLNMLNFFLGLEMNAKYPQLAPGPARPYGSIGCVKETSHTIEIANAGDVSILVEYMDGCTQVISRDDVKLWDERTFEEARRLAEKFNTTVKFVMANRGDIRFASINEKMHESTMAGMTGRIKRIHGLGNFEVTHSTSIDKRDVRCIFIFSDGAIPPGMKLTNGAEHRALISLFCNLRSLRSAIYEARAQDPNMEISPCFSEIDDGSVLVIDFDSK